MKNLFEGERNDLERRTEAFEILEWKRRK